MPGLGSNVTNSQAVISLRAYLNPIGATQQNLVSYTSGDTLEAAGSALLVGFLSPGAGGISYDLATMFPAYTAPVFVCITDISNPGIGFFVGTDNTSNTMGVGANGFMAYTGNGSTGLPVVYLSNPSSTQELYVQFAIMTQ